PTKLLDALESTRRSPKSIAIVTSKFPSVHFISAGARDVAAARGVKVVLYLEYEFGNRDFAPIAARIKEADPDFLWVGAIGLDDKAIAAWLKANHADTPFGRLSFEGENNYGAEHTKVKQNQNGRWVIVWPREFAAPGANIVYPAP